MPTKNVARKAKKMLNGSNSQQRFEISAVKSAETVDYVDKMSVVAKSRKTCYTPQKHNDAHLYNQALKND